LAVRWALLDADWALLSVYRTLLSVDRTLVTVHRALLGVHRSPLSVYRSLLSVYRALLRVHRDLLSLYLGHLFFWVYEGLFKLYGNLHQKSNSLFSSHTRRDTASIYNALQHILSSSECGDTASNCNAQHRTATHCDIVFIKRVKRHCINLQHTSTQSNAL